MQKITKICNLRGWGKFFFPPQYLPNFGLMGLKFFGPLDIKETHFHSEFKDPNPKIGAWGDDRRNKKIRIFDKKGPISK